MKYIDFKEPILSLNSPYWRIQKIGYLCLLILLVAAFIGLTGNGILGTTIKTDPAGVLKVEYDPVLRAHADTLITLWINPKNLAQTPSLTISLSQATFANALVRTYSTHFLYLITLAICLYKYGLNPRCLDC